MNKNNKDQGSDRIDIASKIYDNTLRNSQIAFIILIGFALFFFFMILLPYISLKHTLKDQTNEAFAGNLSNVLRISNEFFNISNTLINQIGHIRQVLGEDYEKLDRYFADIETTESLSPISNVTSNSSLRIPYPLFFKCKSYGIGTKDWGNCNASVVAQDVAANARLKLLPLVEQFEFAKTESGKVQKKLEQSINYLNTTKLPSIIQQSEWQNSRDTLFLLKGRVANLQLKIDQSLTYINSSIGNLWRLIEEPASYSTVATSIDFDLFRNFVDSLTDENERVTEEFLVLSNRIQEIDVPFIGKLSLGLNNTLGIFPLAIAAGFLACSYLVSQTIRSRAVLNRVYEADSKIEFDAHIYPIWIEPLNPKLSYLQLFLVAFVPLILLVSSSSLILSVASQNDSFPLFPFSPELNQQVLIISLILASVLFLIGIIVIIKEINRYSKLAGPQYKTPESGG